MKVPIRLTGTASVGISVARRLPRNRKTTMHHEDEGFDQRLLHLMDRVGDEAVGS